MSKSYAVLTVGEIDRQVYETLLALGAAKPPAVAGGRYEITDVAKARSGHIMPMVLNTYGAKGWHLRAVNRMECFIFEVDPEKPVEYMVSTPPDLDQLALKMLQEDGFANYHVDAEGKQHYQITEPERARVQSVLPEMLMAIAESGWQLAAISGPQLYFFTRPTSGEVTSSQNEESQS